MTFRKARGIDKEIFQEHRKLTGVSDVHAKHRYVGTCRQIKTYGITFFNIKVFISLIDPLALISENHPFFF